MRIVEAVVHVMDKDSGNVVVSHKAVDPSDVVMEEYLQKAIEKLMKTEYTEANLADCRVVANLVNHPADFVANSAQISLDFFDAIKGATKINGGDLLFFRAQNDDLVDMTGMIKLDYNAKYLHSIEYDEDLLVNTIIQNKTILPAPVTTVKDGFLVMGDTIRIQSKKYDNNGEDWTFAQNILQIPVVKKVSEEIKVIERTVKETAKKYTENDVLTVPETHKAVYESIKKDEQIDSEYVAEKVFQDNPEAKVAFREKLKERGVSETVRVPNAPIFEKKYQKQKIKLGNGIEMTVPVDVLKNKDVVEFRTNPDGTMSVIVKNVERE
ncbi:nucleoid-associated protein [Secundilactobacillus odoratitofui]|nr:nucleoid-associated protein [Secundilactobacillus odoratitofui]